MPPDFSSKVIETLSKRVAYRCSNPDCNKLTVGPNTEPGKATNIGEAAHIYGAELGSARYRAVMSDVERSTITNAIWLCRDCHGLIDRDYLRFPPELLLQWKSHQEERIINELGKTGDFMRLQVSKYEIDRLGDIPIFVKSIINDKPKLWEFIATVELLDFYLTPPLRQASQLKKGLYARPRITIEHNEFSQWVDIKLEELMGEIHCIEALMPELTAAWGKLGTPGIPIEILHVCRLYGECAQRLVSIAEETTFSYLPQNFSRIGRHFSKGILHVIERLPELSIYIRSVIQSAELNKSYEFVLKIDLPDGWPEEFRRLLEDGLS